MHVISDILFRCLTQSPFVLKFFLSQPVIKESQS
jgi:hypothetical protein